MFLYFFPRKGTFTDAGDGDGGVQTIAKLTKITRDDYPSYEKEETKENQIETNRERSEKKLARRKIDR